MKIWLIKFKFPFTTFSLFFWNYGIVYILRSISQILRNSVLYLQRSHQFCLHWAVKKLSCYQVLTKVNLLLNRRLHSDNTNIDLLIVCMKFLADWFKNISLAITSSTSVFWIKSQSRKLSWYQINISRGLILPISAKLVSSKCPLSLPVNATTSPGRDAWSRFLRTLKSK